jgi:hypothetical protein
VTLQAKNPRPKKCRVESCRTLFVPARMGQAVCSPACAIIDAPKNQEKASKARAKIERKETKDRKEKIKTKAAHMKDAQTAFNAWVRARDAGLPCISCGTTADVQYAAGHFRSAGGHPELRFEPLNVHLQCNRNCNMAKSGNLGPYRFELIKRIGQDKVDWLEGPHEPKRYTIEDLKAITAQYRAKTRELKRTTA